MNNTGLIIIDKRLQRLQNMALYITILLELCLPQLLEDHLYQLINLLLIIQEFLVISVKLLNQEMHWNVSFITKMLYKVFKIVLEYLLSFRLVCCEFC